MHRPARSSKLLAAFAVAIAVLTTPVTTPAAATVGPIASCPAGVRLDEGQAASAVVAASDADSAVTDVAITSEAVDGITLTARSPGTATLEVAASTIADTHPVEITFTTDDGRTVTCTVAVSIADQILVSGIQGPGAASPRVGDRVIVDAVVTALFTRGDVLDGFFVQEEVADGDGDDATSEGIFVFCRGTCPTLAAGDLVHLEGTAAEFFAMTQIDVTRGSITVRSPTGTLPEPVPVTLPAATSTRDATTFEALEGMIVEVTSTLTVTEHFELARFGTVELTSGERPFQFTHHHEPDADGYADHLADLARRTIILDDDNNDQNDAISGPVANEAYAYPSGGLSLENDLRAGDTVTGLTGVLHWGFNGLNPPDTAPPDANDAWRLRPLATETYDFERTNGRPDEVEDVGGRIKVAAFNVLNYFTSIDRTSSSSSGPCGPSGTLDCRGADSEAELARQRAKEIVAIGALDADVVGLVELQNDDGTAVRDLVAGLNARPGAVRYAELETGPIGTDAIKVTFIYRASTVTPVGAHDILDSSDDPRFVATLNRPALTQQFAENLTGERFTASINHLKSKGSACPEDVVPPGGAPELPDGQGNCSETRTNAAAALADHLADLVAAGWDPDVIIMGDLNSYRLETPITTLHDAGYTDLIDEVVGEDGYSYLFDGQVGYLDHAMANQTFAEQVTGVTEWHVNADEVPLFDYNDDVLDAPGEAPFERESTARPLYAADERRSSDHDPVVLGLDLASLTIDDALIVGSPQGGGRLLVTGTTGSETTTCPLLSLRVNGRDVPIGRTTRLGSSSTCQVLTSNELFTFDLDTGAFTGLLVLPASFVLTGSAVTFVLGVGDVTYGVVRDGRRTGQVWNAG